MRRALVLALRDYVRKNGFGEVVLGLSGGIDSALVGGARGRGARAERVHCVSMPSRYSSEGTQRRRAAARREPRLRLPRDPDRGRSSARSTRRSAGSRASRPRTCRRGSAATMLMALSNTHGWLVLATGNKSELSVGYSTLYGDLAGGFALIKDVYKTDVFRLVVAPERAGRPRADPALDHRARAVRRAARRPARRRLAAAVRPSSTAVLEAYVELDRSREELSPRGSTRRSSSARSR